ncbi:MAG: putative lipid II flippase FtsW [Myxococcales bacterium]|nr:putative lipid II flippase FtsW [Myxococcales bacterium]
MHSWPPEPPAREPDAEAQQKTADTHGHDVLLFTAILGLCGFGVVMVYSASAVYAAQKFGAADHFLRRDLAYTALGLVMLAVAVRKDYGSYRRLAYPLLGLAFFLLVAVLIAGVRINGARRWFHLGPLSFQPAELAKLAVVIYLARSLAQKAEKVKSFAVGFVPHMFIAAVFMLLLLKQPDLGTAVILGLTTLMLMFVAGAKVSYLVLAFLGAAPIVYQAIVGTPWRLKRMLAYIDPWPYRYDVGYQITESLISIGSGGLTGLGLGDGKQKLFFLPEAHTDYILAIVGEELGWAGLVCIAACFTLIVWRGARAALRARDAFGCYLAFGITAIIALQAVVNLGVVLGALPTKGLPLPFVSFGGSTLVVDLFAAGILLNISRGAPEPVPRAFPSLWTRLFGSRANKRRRGGGHRVQVESASDDG